MTGLIYQIANGSHPHGMEGIRHLLPISPLEEIKQNYDELSDKHKKRVNFPYGMILDAHRNAHSSSEVPNVNLSILRSVGDRPYTLTSEVNIESPLKKIEVQ